MLFKHYDGETKAQKPEQVTLKGDGGPAGGSDQHDFMPCCWSACSWCFQYQHLRCCFQRGKGCRKLAVASLQSKGTLHKEEKEVNQQEIRKTANTDTQDTKKEKKNSPGRPAAVELISMPVG